MKVCKNCKLELPDDAFRPQRLSCRKCDNAKDKRTYASRIAHREKLAKIVNDVLSCSSCSECCESDNRVLDFHHRDPSTKKYTIGQMKNLSVSEKTLLEEIAKCDILCANCHIRETYNGVLGVSRKYKEKQYATVDAYIAEHGPCKNCGESRRELLVFHHIEPGTKVASVSDLIQRHSKPEVLIAEMEKCDILCHNCHRKVHMNGN